MKHAFRITFEYDGEKFALKSTRRVTMRVPRGQSPAEIGRDLTGRFVELRGARDELLYRRTVAGLMEPKVEYPTGDPARPFGHAKPPKGMIASVLVPARDGARKVAVVETKGREAGKSEAKTTSRDLFIVDLPAAEAGQ
ncbi:MAG: hypothetical protein WCZ66_09980 [Sphingomonadaceae bacterium]